MSKQLLIARDLSLPADAATQTFLVVGKRGSGKTTTATRIVEQLRAGEARMLDAVIASDAGGIMRDILAEKSGFTAAGGTFQNYLGTLKRSGLVVESDGVIRGGDALTL